MFEATQHLTDEAFESWLHDTFYRPVLVALAQKACSEDVRALDAYLKRADVWRRNKRSPSLCSPQGPQHSYEGTARQVCATLG